MKHSRKSGTTISMVYKESLIDNVTSRKPRCTPVTLICAARSHSNIIQLNGT